MKKMLLFVLFFITTINYSQTNYEAFKYNGKFGVVHRNTLEELIEPSFEYFKPIFNDAIVLTNGKPVFKKVETLYYFFDKSTGERVEYSSPYGQDELFFQKKTYYHFVKDNKSILIHPENFKENIIFDKSYKNITNGYIDSNNLIATNFNDTYDVFNKQDYTKAKYVNIKAKYFYAGRVIDKSNEEDQDMYVLYGNDSVFIFNESFDLVKEYHKSITTKQEMIDAISNDYIINERSREHGARNRDPEIWNFKHDDTTTFIKSTDNKISFKIKGIYYSSADPYNNSPLITKHWVFLNKKLYKENVTHSFGIDFEKKKFILPKKYQEELELKFIN